MKTTIAAILVALAAVNACPALADERREVAPVEREGLGLLPAIEGIKKAVPEEKGISIKREDISKAARLAKKAPLVLITEPSPGNSDRSCRKIRGRVGSGITKIFLRVNSETQVVAANGGVFETELALEPGVNKITALAADLDGNLGKDSVEVFYKASPGGPDVVITEPGDGASLDLTSDRVITVAARVRGAEASEGYLVINGMPKRVAFEKGVMTQNAALLPGANILSVEAVSRAGQAGKSPPIKIDTFDARPKDLVAILTWDSPTADFDLHVWDSFGHHTFNEAPDAGLCEAAIPGGSLDMDRKGSFGPEVFSLEVASPEVYTLFVKYNPGLKDRGANAFLKVLLHGEDSSRRITRTFGPVRLDKENAVWEAAHVKMPEGVFFQEKEADLAKTFGMDSKAVKRLSMMLDEESPAFRLLAISVLGQIKSEVAVEPLLKCLSSGPADIRRAAAAALWSIKSVRSVQALARSLKDEDAEVRRLAAGALGNIGSTECLPSLTGLLVEETVVTVRVEVLRALGRLGDQRAFDSVNSQVKDPEPRVRVEAVRSLGYIKEPASEKVLLETLQDKDAGIRGIAAWSLGMLGLKSSAKPLTDALRFEDDESVRVQAAVALGMIMEPVSRSELERAAEKDPSERVRNCASKSLATMAGLKDASGELPPVELDEDVIIY
jgi:HEAT repeat protein